MHVSLNPQLPVQEASSAAKDKMIRDFRAKYGRDPEPDELKAAIATEVEMFNLGLIEKVIVDRVTCTIPKDHYTSPEFIKTLESYRSNIFGKNIRLRIDQYIERRISEYSGVRSADKPKFVFIYDAYMNTKHADNRLLSQAQTQINRFEGFEINRFEIIGDVYPEVYSNISSKVRNAVLKLRPGIGFRSFEDFMNVDSTNPEFKRVTKAYIRTFYELLQVADYISSRLLNKALEARFDICYVYQKLNLYEFTCILENYAEYFTSSDNSAYSVDIYIPILDTETYQRRVTARLNQYGVYLSPKLTKSLSDRYYAFLINAILYTDHRIWIAPVYQDYILIDRSGISPENMQIIQQISDSRLVTFIKLMNKLTKYLQLAKTGNYVFLYNKSLEPEANLARITDPGVIQNIEKIKSTNKAIIDQLPISQRRLEIIAGPMGTGKSTHRRRILTKDMFVIDTDTIALSFPDYESNRNMLMNQIRNDLNTDDILLRTVELIMSNTIHRQFVSYAWIPYFQLVQYAAERGVNILTEITARDEAVFRAIVNYAKSYQIKLHVIHTRFDQQYYNQLKRGVEELRVSFRENLLDFTNTTFVNIYSIISNPEFDDIDVYIYENTDFSIERPDSLLLSRIRGQITCYKNPNSMQIETGVNTLFDKLCSMRAGNTSNSIMIAFIIIAIIVITIVVITVVKTVATVIAALIIKNPADLPYVENM